MSQQDVETARRGYAMLNMAYRTGDVNDLRPFAEKFWDPEVVFEPAGVLPESRSVHGRSEVLRFIEGQMQAFEPGTMWMKPLEYIDVGERLVVPYGWGGRARHTGIEMEFTFVHVITTRQGRMVRMEAFASKSEALEAVGLSEQDAHADST
jgi:ketosteroid isomerase-like protein